MNKRRLSLIMVGLLLLLLAACAKGEEGESSEITGTGGSSSARDESSGETIDLYVLAAASLTDVMTDLQTLYREKNPGVNLVFSFESSGTLQQQIEEGAPADLFISAANKQMDRLDEQGLIDGDSRLALLRNEVVLIVPAGESSDVENFEDLATDKVKMVAVGDSSVPVGQYTEEIFRHLGLWEQIEEKANFATNVRNVLAWVEEKQADCGIVYATDAAISDKVDIVCSAPEGSHKPVIYPAAVLKKSDQPEEARAFLDFLLTEEAVARFEYYGFTLADR